MFQAEWRWRENVLRVEPFQPLTSAEQDDLASEATRLLELIAPDRSVTLDLHPAG